MTATPKYGTFTFVGLNSGKTWAVELYVSDVASGLLRFDDGAGAGAATQTYYKVPEDCRLVDYAQVTGTAVTEKFRVTCNGRPTAHILRYDTHLTSLATRPPLNIYFKKDSEVSGFQIAD